MVKKPTVAGLALCMLLSLASANAQAAYTDIIFFGDSLLDSGSPFATAVLGPPYTNFEFSNGPVWGETFAGEFGFGFDWGVNNFAVGGAISADLTVATSDSQVNFVGQSQVDQYLDSTKGGLADANALYVIGIGGNDFLQQIPDTINTVLDNAEAAIQALEAVGAENFLIMNSPDTSVSPFTPAVLNPFIRAIAIDFNNAMDDRLGDDYWIFDTFSFIDEYPANLLDADGNFGITLGLENAGTCLGTPACAVAAPGGDSSDFLLFDDIHPTKETHEALGLAVAAAYIPIPAPFVLMLSALATLGWVRRRQVAA